MSPEYPENSFVDRAVPAPEPSLGQAAPRIPNTWRARDLILFLISGVVALLAANFLALTGYALLQPLVGWKVRPEALRENPFFLLSLQTVFHALVLGYVYLLIVVNYREPFWAALRWYRLTSRHALRFFAGGVLLAVAVQFAPSLLPDREDFPLQRLFTSPQAAYAIGAFAVLVAPFMEELIFRGVLFRFFERLAGLRSAVVGTAALFAALHVPEYWGAWNRVLLISLVGLTFSLARGLTGSLTPSVVLHAGYNASLMAMLFYETQAFQALGTIME